MEGYGKTYIFLTQEEIDRMRQELENDANEVNELLNQVENG